MYASSEWQESYRGYVMQATFELLRLYTSILLPVLVVSVWMFALYAALSYAVPAVLCSSALRSNAVCRQLYIQAPQLTEYLSPTCVAKVVANDSHLQGITQGFVDCVYNHGGDYSHDVGIKIFWLLFWAAQQFWISGFSGLMGYAMFPRCFRAIDLLIIVTLAVGSAMVTLIGAPLGHYDLNSNLLVLLPGEHPSGEASTTALEKIDQRLTCDYGKPVHVHIAASRLIQHNRRAHWHAKVCCKIAAVVTAGVTITTGFASARYTGSKVDAARYLCMFGLGGVVVAIYTFLMPT